MGIITHLYICFKLWAVHLRQQLYVMKLKRRKSVKIVFFAMNLPMWRYQHLYEELKKYDCFKLYVVLSPAVNIPEEVRNNDLKAMRDFFRQKGVSFMDYNPMSPCAIRECIDPDILFYPQPYSSMLHPLHDFLNFKDKLLCYYPYAFWTAKGSWSYNTVFHIYAWKLFYSTELHRLDAKAISWRKDKNVEVVGYPNTDDFLAFDRKNDSLWKKQTTKKKRLIWAPHFSIPNGMPRLLDMSNFLWMADLMVSMAKKYEEQIQIAFKPHPFLKRELYKNLDWGKEKTDRYYQLWNDMDNTQLETSGFVDLFMTSDALIHDCGSFTVEYLYSKNPVMYMLRDEAYKISTQNDFGIKALNVHYKGRNEQDVVLFIEQVLLQGNDPMKAEREKFYKEYLLPPRGKSVAKATAEIIVKSLNKHT